MLDQHVLLPECGVKISKHRYFEIGSNNEVNDVVDEMLTNSRDIKKRVGFARLFRMWPVLVLATVLLGCRDEDRSPVMPTQPADKSGALTKSIKRPALDWVRVEGGHFKMGIQTESNDKGEYFVHDESVATLDVMRHEVTVAEYTECVNANVCWPRIDVDMQSEHCNYNKKDAAEQPMNCIDWYQASSFCAWAGGRLPAEAEWEYVATNRGRPSLYPWGDARPSCDLAVVRIKGECEDLVTQKVCSHAAGNTESGICDMVGNVSEWVRDFYYPTYTYRYAEFSARETVSSAESKIESEHVIRGSAVSDSENLAVRNRMMHAAFYQDASVGVRCIKDVAGVVAVKSAYEIFYAESRLARKFTNLKAIKGDAVSQADAEGFTWDQNPNVIIPESGVRIEYDQIIKAKNIEISLDNNDRYTLQFWLDRKQVGALTLGPEDNPSGGLEKYAEPLPLEAVEGFNKLVIMPSIGDHYYSVGHIVYD